MVNGALLQQGEMANMGDDRCDRAAQRFFLLRHANTLPISRVQPSRQLKSGLGSANA